MDGARQGCQPIRILIAEHAEIVRRGIRDVLAVEEGFVVVGEVDWPRELPQACKNLLPDITFLGLRRAAPGHGDAPPDLEVLRETVQAYPSTMVIVLVDGRDVSDIMDQIRAGARGILLRDAPASLLLTAVYDVLDGGCVLDPRLMRVLFERLLATSVRPRNDAEDFASPPREGERRRSPLSGRELEVLRWMRQGLRNKEIASALGVTAGTVKTHVCHIFGKLHVHDRTSAVMAGLRTGLLEGSPVVNARMANSDENTNREHVSLVAGTERQQ